LAIGIASYSHVKVKGHNTQQVKKEEEEHNKSYFNVWHRLLGIVPLDLLL
jgi:hypothetical protein